MSGPTTAYGKALHERVGEEIKNSELGAKSSYLLFIPISRALYEVYRDNPGHWDIRLASNHDGIVSMILVAKGHDEDI